MRGSCQSQAEAVVTCSWAGGNEQDRAGVQDSNSSPARNVGSLLSSFPLNTILTELQGLDHIKGRGLSYTLAPIPESAIPPQSSQCFYIRPLSYSWSPSYFYPNLTSYFHFAAGNTETHRKPVLRPRWLSAQGSGHHGTGFTVAAGVKWATKGAAGEASD